MRMINTLVAAIASFALSFGSVNLGGVTVDLNPAFAANPSGHRFCDVPLKDNKDLHDRMQEAGDNALRGCRATWEHFKLAWQKQFPGVKLDTREDVMAFVLKLTPMQIKKDTEYQSAMLVLLPNGVYNVSMAGQQRPIVQGETVYAYNGKAALMSNCANPGVVEVNTVIEVKQACLEVHFPSAKGGATRFAYIGPRRLSTKCVKLDMAGDTTKRFAYNLPEECPNKYSKVIDGRVETVVCKWDDVEEAVSRQLGVHAEVQNVSGSFYGRADSSDNVMYLPPQALEGEFVVCYDEQAITRGVRKVQYVNGRIATITHTEVFGR